MSATEQLYRRALEDIVELHRGHGAALMASEALMLGEETGPCATPLIVRYVRGPDHREVRLVESDVVCELHGAHRGPHRRGDTSWARSTTQGEQPKLSIDESVAPIHTDTSLIAHPVVPQRG